jgi:hypothetical protein
MLSKAGRQKPILDRSGRSHPAWRTDACSSAPVRRVGVTEIFPKKVQGTFCRACSVAWHWANHHLEAKAKNIATRSRGLTSSCVLDQDRLRGKAGETPRAPNVGKSAGSACAGRTAAHAAVGRSKRPHPATAPPGCRSFAIVASGGRRTYRPWGKPPHSFVFMRVTGIRRLPAALAVSILPELRANP